MSGRVQVHIAFFIYFTYIIQNPLFDEISFYFIPNLNLLISIYNKSKQSYPLFKMFGQQIKSSTSPTRIISFLFVKRRTGEQFIRFHLILV